MGHIAASPQLRIHGTPSPHLSVSGVHSAAGSPAHPAGLLTIDRPTSRESYSMTPPRAQVFPVSCGIDWPSDRLGYPLNHAWLLENSFVMIAQYVELLEFPHSLLR